MNRTYFAEDIPYHVCAGKAGVFDTGIEWRVHLDGPCWVMYIDGKRRRQVWYCPFCGVDLSKEEHD